MATGDPQETAAGGEVGEAMEVEVEVEAEAEEERCLDLTSCQLHDLSEVEIPPTLEELDLTANRLAAVDPRIGRLPGCASSPSGRTSSTTTRRAHLPWGDIAGLQELVLRDNKLTTIPDASLFKGLLVFDVSFNEIFSLNGLSMVSGTLKELYVSKNEVAKIEELEHFHSLEILELGSNRLRVLENLETLTYLQELWLGRNRIKIINLCGLKSIKKLSLQSNRLTSMNGLQECIALEELYLSHNGIQKMEGLSTLQNLRVLDVSSNKLTAIEDIETLTRLEDLWLNDNQIPSLDGMESALSSSREKLTTIYLERNPCAKTPNYLSTLKRIFPNLEQLDSDMLA
ncbi:hypothetical protein GUJ93_ZPchr0597g2914 [Zizania palustris]|uniref:Protein phosphatase 1 regulatory subunit pprA n=1 Tax=Zizania palustris TaxID=103762 RepID=A0A8J5UZE3_ZIZPA|nr:hypothetical protein GUJ93_ZPchr0597g2914 [Zizania palustris]